MEITTSIARAASKAFTGSMVFAVMGCGHGATTPEASGHSTSSRPPAATAESEPPPARPWPEGWVVIDEEFWNPVLVDFDRDVASARNAFARGDRETAKDSLEAAAAWLSSHTLQEKPQGMNEAERTEVALRHLAKRVSSSKGMSVREFDRALRRAYPRNLGQLWSAEYEEAIIPIHEHPGPHFSRARKMMAEHDALGAAYELRRAADWMDVVARGRMTDEDRRAFWKGEAELRNVADDIVAERPNAETEMTAALKLADTDYEMHYLHWAQRATDDKEYSVVDVPMRALATRIERSAKWMGQTLDEESKRLASDLRSVAKDVKERGQTVDLEIRRVLARARDYLAARKGQ